MNYIQQLWNWTFSFEPIPILSALAIYYTPTFIRGRARFLYTPTYFTMAPLLSINYDTGNYLGAGFLGTISAKNEAHKRRRIIVTALFSAIIDVILIPAAVATIWSLVLTQDQFQVALIMFLLIQIGRLISSLINYHFHRYVEKASRTLIGVFYIFVVAIVTTIIISVNRFVHSFTSTGDYTGLILAIAQTIFVKGLAFAVLVAIATGVVTAIILDPTVREQHLED